MKKYILNLFVTSENSDAEQLLAAQKLSFAIAQYNNSGTEQDFINYLHNELPYLFIFFEYSGGKVFDVQLRDQSKRFGTIDVVDVAELKAGLKNLLAAYDKATENMVTRPGWDAAAAAKRLISSSN